MATERLIGHVGVDAGVVVVGDPCYLVAGGGVDPQWQDVVQQLVDPENPHRIGGTSAVEVEGTIVTNTPAGDDMFPVYAELDEDGQVLSLRIDLRPAP